jgi:hypothetical protein
VGRFSGRGGELYAVAEPFAFEGLPLEDCGDGWTWRMASPALRCFADSPLTFEVYAFPGQWLPLPVDQLHPAVGAVELGRCIRNQPVRASGVALPQSLLGRAEAWVLEVMVMFGAPALGGVGAPASRQTGSGVRLDGIELEREPESPVRVVMPFGLGAYVGFGPKVNVKPSIAQVTLDERGANYGPA